jgi:hypothetical protein
VQNTPLEVEVVEVLRTTGLFGSDLSHNIDRVLDTIEDIISSSDDDDGMSRSKKMKVGSNEILVLVEQHSLR